MSRLASRFVLSCLALLVSCTLVPSSTSADDDVPKPRVKLFLSSAERVLGDLDWIIAQLAGEDRVWEEKIFPSLDIFLLGVDRDKPIRFDAMIGGEDKGAVNPGSYRLQPCIPIGSNGRELRSFIKDNLEPTGITVRQRSRGGYYSLGNAYEGWMRMVDEYACIGTYESDVPKGMENPTKSHERLAEANYDVALELENRPEQSELRAADFKVFHDNLVDATQIKEGESEAAFNLRKTSVRHNLEILGRFYERARRITVGWVTEVENKNGQADLYGEGLPDSELEAYIASISAEPSRFAALEMPEDPAASLRLNLPYSEFRQRQLKESYAAMRPVMHEKIDDAENITSEEKAPAKQISDLVYDMLEAGIEMGRLDLYIDMVKTEAGPHVIIVAVRAADGKKADEIVKLIPQAHTAWKTELDIEAVGETSIHKVDLKDDLPMALVDTFGGSGVVYVGTSADLVWICGGEGSLDLLKSTITKVDEAEAPEEVSPVFGQFKLRAHTLLKLYDSLVVEMAWTPVKKLEVQPKRNSGSGPGLQPIDPAEIRDLATRATADMDDRVSGIARRIENHAEGEIHVQPGVLRAVGKIIAKIAADNL